MTRLNFKEKGIVQDGGNGEEKEKEDKPVTKALHKHGKRSGSGEHENEISRSGTEAGGTPKRTGSDFGQEEAAEAD